MLEYRNTKTNSLIHIPDDLKLSDVDNYAYLIKMMIYHDNYLIKDKMQKLVNCLVQVKERRRLGEWKDMQAVTGINLLFQDD